MNSPERIQKASQSFFAASSPTKSASHEEEYDDTQEDCIEAEDERNAVQEGIDFDTPDPDADDPAP